jgi:hypothetical protein
MGAIIPFWKKKLENQTYPVSGDFLEIPSVYHKVETLPVLLLVTGY